MIAQAEGFAPAFKTATLTAGGRTTVDIGLLLDGVVTGSVVDRSGAAVAGAIVHVEYNGFEDAVILSSFIGDQTMSDAGGRFRVNGIVPNEGFTIYAELDGKRSSSFSLRATPGVPIENVVLNFN